MSNSIVGLLDGDGLDEIYHVIELVLLGFDPYTTKKYTSVMIRVCHSRSCFLSCMYIHDDFMRESR